MSSNIETPTTNSEKKTEGYFNKLWNGDKSLAHVWWLWIVFGGLLWRLALVPVELFLAEWHWLILFIAMNLMYLIFVWICAWRTASKNKTGWGSVVKILIVLSVITMIAAMGQLALIFNETENTSTLEFDIDTVLADTAAEINKTAPLVLDSITTMDGAEAIGNTIIYFYTLDADKDTISPAALEDHVSKNTCESDFLYILEMGGNAQYTYRGLNGTEFHSFNLTHDRCIKIMDEN